MDEFIKQLQPVWPLVMQATWGFAVLTAAVFATGWGVGRFIFGERIETLKARIEDRNERIAEYERKLGGASPDEAQQKIEALERRLQALEPRSLTPDQIEKMGGILAKHPGIVSIVKEMGSPVSRIHTQVEKLFRANGWEVMSGAAFGVTKADNGILITTRSGDQSTEQAQIVMNAFATAGLAFERRRQPVAPPNAMNTPELEILFTDF